MKLSRFMVLAIIGVLIGAVTTAYSEQLIVKPFAPVDETPRWVEDEFIVVLKPAFKSNFDVQLDKRANRLTVNIASIQRLVDQHNVTGINRQFPIETASWAPELTAYFKVKLVMGQNLDAAAAAFAADPAVDHVEKIGIHAVTANCATGTPRPANDTYYNNPPPTFNWPQWDLWDTKGIDAEMAWSAETGDATVVVVAMDTGVKYTHKDLGGNNPPGPSDNSTDGNVWTNPFETPGNGIDDEGNGYIDDVVGYDFVTGVSGCASGEDCSAIDNNPMDFNGHGTHTAGTMAAITNNARAVAGIAGGFGDGTVNSVGNGCKIMCMRIGWSDAVGNGFVRMDFAAQAINYVVGMKQRGVNVASINCSWGTSNSGGVGAALDAAMNNDILVCHAAGNANSSVADYFGGRTEILNVAATDQAGLKASFSNFGSWVDIAAPGVAIISTYQVGTDPLPDYVAVLDGTSMASPHCAGVAGMLESANSSLTRAQKFSLMTGNICPAGSPNIGSGILNAKKALDAAGGGPQPPVAQFVGSPTSGCAPLTVNFTDQSSNSPTSWAWDFGDGGTSTVQNPSHSYAAAGSYTVTLTATNAAGADSEVKVNYISVGSGAPTANFSGTPTSGNAPLAVSFTDLSTGGPTSWAWTFGDGGTSTAQNPSHTYSAAGTYTVALTASNACGPNTNTKTNYITVTAPPTPQMYVSYQNAGRIPASGRRWRGVDTVEVRLVSNNALVSVASVTASYAGPSSGTASGTTGANGRVVLQTGNVKNPAGTWCFTVTSVTKAGHVWNSSMGDNTECENDHLNAAGPLIASIEAPEIDNDALSSVYPNPFNAGTNITFRMTTDGRAELRVYDILGRTVRTLASGYYAAGTHTLPFDGRNDNGQTLASGVYLYRLVAPGIKESRKMILLK